MTRKSKIGCGNKIRNRQVTGAEFRSQSGLEFVDTILFKYRMRRNAGRLSDLIFRRPFQPAGPGEAMAAPNYFNNYFRMQFHFQGSFNNYQHQLSPAVKAVPNNGPGRSGADPKRLERISGNELGWPRLTTVIRDRILVNRVMENRYLPQPLGRGIGLQKVLYIPDGPADRVRNVPVQVAPAQERVTVMREPITGVQPRQLPVREILRWKPPVNSGKELGEQRVETLKAHFEGGKYPVRHLPTLAMKMPKMTALKPSQPVEPNVLPNIQISNISGQPSVTTPRAFSGERDRFIYQAVPGQRETPAEIFSGLKTGDGGLVPVMREQAGINLGNHRRQKYTLSKNEFIWRKTADTAQNSIKIAAAGTVETAKTVSNVAIQPGNYPEIGATKAVPEINTIVAAVLKSLDKRIAIERDKRGRR